MIDSREKLPPILKCPKCSTLYGPNMKVCSRCKGPLVPALGPKRLPDVPFVTRAITPGSYDRDQPIAVGLPIVHKV